jgi:hypothetical protein
MQRKSLVLLEGLSDRHIEFVNGALRADVRFLQAPVSRAPKAKTKTT